MTHHHSRSTSRSRRGSSSSDRDSVGESTAGHESSFESSESSGIGESIVSSTKNSIPILDFPDRDHTPRFLQITTRVLHSIFDKKVIPKKIPSARNSRNRQVELERRHSFRAKGSKSCSSLSNSNATLYATIGHSGQSQHHHHQRTEQVGHPSVPDPLSKSMSAYDRVKINSKTPQNSPKTTELINSFQRQNRGLYKQVSIFSHFEKLKPLFSGH